MLSVCLLSVCLLSMLSGVSPLNGMDPQTFSGHFGFGELSGVRSFPPEQEFESRIIGGQEAWRNSWPWQVSLRFASMPACGGAIIGPLWVVSAAHCFKRYNKASFWTVLAGKHDLDNNQEPGQQLVGVFRILIHQDYNPRTKERDLALLKLQNRLDFNAFVRPIDVWMSPLSPHRRCTITGWGSTRENGPRVNRLQEVNVTILSSESCNQFYLGRMRPSMFCAGSPGGGADACQGDSGGPLSCFTGSRYELAGLVSWGVGCGRARKPGVYTKLQTQTQWMMDVMSDEDLLSADQVSEEDICGLGSGCGGALGLASLFVSQDGGVSVGNVSEVCPSSWPWQVSLQAEGRHYCSGTMIHRDWVLVPQHCYIRAKEDVVVLGVHDLRFSSSQTVPVDAVVNLPRDGTFPPQSDLSLLRLSMSARLSSDVSPVCIPDEDEELDSSWSCVTTGWGATKVSVAAVDPDRLHQVGLTLVNHTTCRQQWGGDIVTDSHICAHPAGSASCMGDRGAPLFCRKRAAYFLFGVLTWGSRRCDADRPSIFSRVSDHHVWISEVTQDL
ncbi:ovochymase-1 isoform X1 [Eleginops maclovinus]|uniref:ovochymase-1 isoform X1 n=2 Tax=Eleginops maclovinus TaxID=56733 RepID=UPI0030801F38